MFEVAISRYLKHHGHSDIRLKAVLFDMDGVLSTPCPIMPTLGTRSWNVAACI